MQRVHVRLLFIALVCLASVPGHALTTRRVLSEIRQEIASHHAALAEQAVRLDELSKVPPSPGLPARLAEIARRIQQHVQALRALDAELAVACEARPTPPPPPSPIPPPMPPPPPPPPRPRPMEGEAFRALKDQLKAEAFENNRLELLRDAVTAGARFDTAQAVTVVKLFAFPAGQVDASVLLCEQAIVTPGALPALTGALTFEPDRQTLRKKTHGRCGILTP